MLGSIHDTGDVLQGVEFKAWRALATFGMLAADHGLSVDPSDDEFDHVLDAAIRSIFDASRT